MNDIPDYVPAVPLEDIWRFMQDEGIGAGHVAEMKKCAPEFANIIGKIAYEDIPKLVGNAELTEKLMSRVATGRYVRASQVGVCGDGE